MEKLAIIELNTSSIKLTLSYVLRNKSFLVYNEVVIPVNLTKDFEKEEIIKSTAIKDVVNTLLVYKKMIEKEGVTETLAISSDFVTRAKNLNGFINEIHSTTNFNFRVLTPEEEINYVYASTINTFNKPKALIFNVSEYNTQILLYNRRNVLEVAVLPVGTNNAISVVGEQENTEKTYDAISQHIATLLKDLNYVSGLEEEFEVIGAGKSFVNLGAISRRAKKYPLDVDHNYVVSREDFSTVAQRIKSLDNLEGVKIKGVEVADTKYLPIGLAIIEGVFSEINKNEISISAYGKLEGVLLNTIIPLTLEKPISDNLGYSLQVNNEYYDRKPNNSEHVYNISMILFKQLKVLHKLNRSFVRVLRIASYLSAIGKRIDYKNHENASFDAIINSNVYGVSHSELVLAGFVALLRNPDNFNMTDWIKYRGIVQEDDIDAVRKLAVILKVAECLDVTTFGYIVDINCDILGDSVILKTITTSDASLEIKQAMLCSNDFKKAFNKNLEIL